MALLQVGMLRFDAELVILDKDGTLIDFESMWGRLAEAAVERLAAETGGDALESELYAALGYDRSARRTRPESPLSIATTGQLWTIAAAVLYRHGIPWSAAEGRAQRAFEDQDDLPLASLIRPTGDVLGLLSSLRAAGVHVAVVTTDHRAETEETLAILGVGHLVETVVCGDDGVPWKPAPDAVLITCERLGAAVARTAVVGDTMADLLMAQRAGAGLRAAVLTGAGDPEQLRVNSDVLLQSIDEIAVVQASGADGGPFSL